MAKNINITVNTASRKVRTDTEILGVKDENLQGYFVVDFEGKEFIEGAGWLETQIGESKGYIALTRENNTYKAPIKSAITQATGEVQLQVRITQGAVADATPIFKSDIFTLTVLDSISAVDEIPDKYPEWIDVANAKLAEIDKAISEVEEAKGKSFVKQFTKADFTQVGTAQRYFIAIKQAEHGLTNPYVDKMLVNRKADGEETTTFQTAVAVGEKTISTGTIKVYITIDLSKYTEYSGTIYLRGE